MFNPDHLPSEVKMSVCCTGTPATTFPTPQNVSCLKFMSRLLWKFLSNTVNWTWKRRSFRGIIFNPVFALKKNFGWPSGKKNIHKTKVCRKINKSWPTSEPGKEPLKSILAYPCISELPSLWASSWILRCLLAVARHDAHFNFSSCPPSPSPPISPSTPSISTPSPWF